ncbi:MAG: ligase-associated DNA damage response endonuclease PdeM [Rubrivivax sp.]|nr:ligase-associated DNA damage response endonuclease PdeM [Rubrivivax sp.]
MPVLEVQAAGTTLRLLAQRALFLPEFDTLLVADAHIGKARSFRRLGVPVPEATTDETLARLSQAVASCGARRLVFLGDLLHSARAQAAAPLAAVTRWRDSHGSLALTLVRGNHDQHAGDPPPNLDVQCLDGPLRLGPLALCHHPDPIAGAYVLAGHVHPAAVIGGRARDRLRLPCFHLGPAVGVLPAFGAFTGTHVLPRGPEDRVFVVAGDEVRPLHFPA